MASDQTLEDFIDQAIAESADAVADVQKGKLKAIGRIMGKVMALTKGRANPVTTMAMLRQKLGLPEEVKEEKKVVVEAPKKSEHPLRVIDRDFKGKLGGTVYGYGDLVFSLTDVIYDTKVKVPEDIRKYIRDQLIFD